MKMKMCLAKKKKEDEDVLKFKSGQCRNHGNKTDYIRHVWIKKKARERRNEKRVIYSL